jgi:hypothetical protein
MRYSDDHFYDDEDDDIEDCVFDMTAAPNIPKTPIIMLPTPPVEESEDSWAQRSCPLCHREMRKRIHDGSIWCECGRFLWV